MDRFVPENISSLYLFFDKYISPFYGSYHKNHRKSLEKAFHLESITIPDVTEDSYAQIKDNIFYFHVSREKHAVMALFYKDDLVVVNSGFGSGSATNGKINIWKTIRIPNFAKFKSFYTLLWWNINHVREEAQRELEQGFKGENIELILSSGLPFEKSLLYRELTNTNFFNETTKENFLKIAEKFGEEISDEFFLDNRFIPNSAFGGDFEEELKKLIELYNSHPRDDPYTKLALDNKLELINGDLYAGPQKSGSCAFYSMYWMCIFISTRLYGAEKTFKYLLKYIKKKGKELTQACNSVYNKYEESGKFPNVPELLDIISVLDLSYKYGMSDLSGDDFNKRIFNGTHKIIMERSDVNRMETVDREELEEVVSKIRRGEFEPEFDVPHYDFNQSGNELSLFLFALYVYYNGTLEEMKDLKFSSRDFDIILYFDVTIDEYYAINLVCQNLEKFYLVPGFNFFNEMPQIWGGRDIESPSIIPRSLLNMVIYSKEHKQLNSPERIMNFTWGDPSERKEWALKSLYELAIPKKIHELSKYLTLYYGDVVHPYYVGEVDFMYYDMSRYLSVISVAMYETLKDNIIEMKDQGTLTLGSLRKILDETKPLLFPQVPEQVDGIAIRQMEHYFIIGDKKFYPGADENKILDYIIYRLAFTYPIVLFHNEGRASEIYIFESDYIDGDIYNRYAHIIFKDGMFKSITCNGKKVYFGHENNWDWRFYNLPLYGPCFLVEDRFNSYIYGRTSDKVGAGLFGRSSSAPKHFKYNLSKSELFISGGSDRNNLNNVYQHYGLKNSMYSVVGNRDQGIMPHSSMNSYMNKDYNVNLKEELAKWRNVTRYKKYFKSNQLKSIIRKLRKVSQVEEVKPETVTHLSAYDKNVEAAIRRFYKNNFWCIFDCKNADIILGEIKEYIFYLEAEKRKIYENTNFKDYNYLGRLGVLFDNADSILSVLSINVILETLYKIQDLLTTCTGDICSEIAEHIHTLTYPIYNPDKLTNYQIYFMAIFGNFIKPEQFSKVEEIIRDMDKDVRRVHQFMMGKGKSAVITPLIIFDRLSKGENVILAVPNHLESQTLETYKPFFLIDMIAADFLIFPINYLFHYFAEDPDYIEGRTIIFDEFDMMYDPLSSVMNLILKEEDWFDEERLMKVIEIIEGVPSARDEVYPNSIYGAIERNLIKNINYGMISNSRVVVPYMRKDTPLVGSKFASIIYTLVYTILFYKDQEYMLRKVDYAYISRYHRDSVIAHFKINTSEVLEEYLYNYYFDHPAERRIFFIWYVFHILRKELNISSEIMNVVFLDLMTILGKQVGYTGTVNLALPEEYDDNDYKSEIVRDFDEMVNVYFAITGRSTVSENRYVPFSGEEDLLNVVENYDCLIDLMAFFKDYDNETVVRKLAKHINRKAFIFLDGSDKKKMYLPGEDKVYNYDAGISQSFFFYSQKNSIGIDFKQPPRMKGLILISNRTTYTEASQGIYRLRKLNRGHIVDIGFYNEGASAIPKNNLDVYRLLLENDRQAWNERYPHFLIHRFKNLVRRFRDPEDSIEKVRYIFQGDEWTKESILKYLKDKVKFEDDLLTDPAIANIYSEIEELSEEILYEILLGGEGIETKIEKTKEKSLEKIRTNESSNIVYIDHWYYLIVATTPAEIREQFSRIAILLHQEGNYNFYFTDNVYNNSWWYTPLVFFIEVIENNFLVEPMGIAMFYYDRFPMYDINGEPINGSNKNIKVPELFDLFKHFYSEKVFEMWKEKTEIPQVNGMLQSFFQHIDKTPYINLNKYRKYVSFEPWDYSPEPTHYEMNKFILSGKMGNKKDFMISFEPYARKNFIQT